ncbi:helix-turn-helix domain-containing protein [Algiphilus sp.]|uniref:helix-turn-helix domain-containing protein n=1 Tax=Algiphilus sp. TaxID=1872431 RepID=UPI003BAD0065
MPSPTPPTVLLGPRSLIYVGPLGRGLPHTHAANVALVALDRPLLLRLSGGGWIEHGSALIPAGTRHELDPQQARFAVVYADIHAPCWQAMQPGQNLLSELPHSTALRNCLIEVAESAAWIPALEHQLATSLMASLGTPSTARSRLQIALDDYLQPSADLTLDGLAAHMQLSTRRVQHLFLKELGVSYKRVQHWVRFRGAIQAMGQWGTLTDAALEGGFSDSSHFSNAFRSMFGVSARGAGILQGSFRLWTTPW